MKNKLYSKLFVISVFGIAMGFLEAVVVVYLRMIPAVAKTLTLPWIPKFPTELMFTEQLREISTIVMLITFAVLVGKKRWEWLAVFLWVFAIWDIFYYVSLYLLIGWPPSLLTIDVVFLVPITWHVPVISVLVVMMGFLISSFYIFRKKCQ